MKANIHPKYFEAKDGFANYYFNKKEKDRLWGAFQKHGDFTGLKGDQRNFVGVKDEWFVEYIEDRRRHPRDPDGRRERRIARRRDEEASQDVRFALHQHDRRR